MKKLPWAEIAICLSYLGLRTLCHVYILCGVDGKLFGLRGRDLLGIMDLSREELEFVVNTAIVFKTRFYAGEKVIPVLRGKTIALIFQKPSTRTRVSMEVAALQLGASPLVFNWNELQLGRGEPIKDTARVLERYVDAIAARVYSHRDLEELAKYSSVPVINMLSDYEHPLQAIADVMTITEKLGSVKGRKIVFVGDGRNNVAHSLILAVAKMGGTIVVAAPKELWPDERVLRMAQIDANETGGEIIVTENPIEAVTGADVVYTDVWVSMGEEKEAERKISLLKNYQVNVDLMKRAKKTAIFMHCLPAHRGQEVTEDVIEGPWSVVWDQAENRLHAQKAVLALLLG